MLFRLTAFKNKTTEREIQFHVVLANSYTCHVVFRCLIGYIDSSTLIILASFQLLQHKLSLSIDHQQNFAHVSMETLENIPYAIMEKPHW